MWLTRVRWLRFGHRMLEGETKRVRATLTLISLLLVSLAGVACAATTTSEGNAGVTDTAATTEEHTMSSSTTIRRQATTSPSTHQEVFFPQQKPTDALPPSARITGTLVVDDDGCLRINGSGDAPSHLPLWPSYYELSTEGDAIQVLDGKGDFVARVGGRIETGGGEVNQGGTQAELLKNLQNLLGEQSARKLYKRCTGPYWLVGPPEDHIQLPDTGE